MQSQRIVDNPSFGLPSGGLTSAMARKELATVGPNALPEKIPTPLWRRFLKQFRSPLIYILLFALLVDLGIWIIEGTSGVPIEAIAIGIILFLNAALGVFQENKSETALARLQAMAAPRAWVVRDGHLVDIPSAEIVPGDIVRIEGGDRVPADGILDTAQGLIIDESILTGESVPIAKSCGAEVFSGTLVQRGKTYLKVTRTGKNSTMGRLATMISTIERVKTPLEQKLDVFGRQVSRVIMGLAGFIFVIGLLIEGIDRIGHVLLLAVALAVAAIPEGLPAVLTLTLALGVEQMAKKKAIVRRLSAVEALGSVTIIATDKTGTLTENRMTVRKIECADETRMLKAIILANDADHDTKAGDALEQGLLEHVRTCAIEPAAIRERHRRHSCTPFDSAYKFMRATVYEDGELVSYLKGAPEVVIEKCDLSEESKQEWIRKVSVHACEGFRVLGVAYGHGETEERLHFLGLVMMWDPPREEVADAIRTALEAGIRIVMVTGDHPSTALSVAHSIGIPAGKVFSGEALSRMSDDQVYEAAVSCCVFARVSPEDKLRLIDVLQKKGAVVAMTGDGVNDAPALKKSDVGVAMGLRGSDVSREVADIVLADDNFATIVCAIEEGRNIYENIQKFIRFLFSTNLAFVLLFICGSLGSYLQGLTEKGGLLLPLTAVQMLWINIITDGPPALALGFDRNIDVMRFHPRPPNQPLLDRIAVKFIVMGALVKLTFSGVFLMVSPALGYTLLETRTIDFMYEAVAELVMAYPSRQISVTPRRNVFLHITVIGGILVQLIVLQVEPLRKLLGAERLDAKAILAVLAGAFFVWLLAGAITRRLSKQQMDRRVSDVGRSTPDLKE